MCIPCAAETTPIFLSFALQAIYILVPIIPAALIYHWFPDTKVTATGKVTSNWTVKAGGAFAAYIVTVLLGFFLADGTQKMISAMTDSTWTVTGDVKLLDKDGNIVPDADKFLKSLDVEIHPPPRDFSGTRLVVRMPVQKDDPSDYSIHVSIPEFGASDYSFDTLPKSGYKIDRTPPGTRHLHISPGIIIQATAPAHSAPNAAGPTLTPLAQNQGPPARN
jgi:hypothetical protein